MPDREKIIKGLECCIEKLDTVTNKTHGFNCTACPYFKRCDLSGYLLGLPLMKDALALLKAQESVKPVMCTAHAQGANDVWYECSGCGGYLGNYRNSKKLCDKCGRPVQWNG